MAKDKSLRFRAVCPYCEKSFDSRNGVLYWGTVICTDCADKMRKYNTLNDYRKDFDTKNN